MKKSSINQIETKHLNVEFHNHPVIKDINIEIPAKQLTAIIGPSGCGKTTLLKSFNRLLEIQDDVKITGQIVVDGINIMSAGHNVPDIRKKMGLISQKPYPLPMSIFENVAYGLRIHHDKNAKELAENVQHCLQEVGLWNEVKDRLHDPASRLSVGQQQRLCLARAIAVQPEVLLCDEPTSALDPIAAQQIEKLLLKLKKDYTVILVTHTLRQAKRVADYVIFLYFGMVIEQGPADEFFNNPKNPETKAYLSGEIS
ncbi:MAG: phosphate ABC transporter ATP-binding protein [Thermoplasmata archaeon]|nr:phosphate ABC transporter ATP-binding protein [Thermoplasmata archaeon]MBE3137314.1 phosphate ABC transporter ATP-binding protein [Thermoplasmata archaeon]MBE3141740.1 phosphate ABC transporter ATP-binding protein [Thermoplasmata archaeon]